MSVRRSSAASERSSVLSRSTAGAHGEDGQSVNEPSSPSAGAVKPSRNYASSMTSSQMTYETMDQSEDTASQHTVQAHEPASHSPPAPARLKLNPKVVPTNADLKRSNMLDRYTGVRDPSFYATYDLSELAASGKGKAPSVFSLGMSSHKKKTYDVKVTNPIIAAKAAEDTPKEGHGGFGGLFRRSSKASATGPSRQTAVLDTSRDPKQLFEEAEHQAAFEAQEKERLDKEREEKREQLRIEQERDRAARKQANAEAKAEAKEKRRIEKEQAREAKRQSKASANTPTAGPPPRYSQAGAAAGPQSSHHVGDEVPAGEHEGHFHEEFSEVDGQSLSRAKTKDSDATSSSSSSGSSVTEDGNKENVTGTKSADASHIPAGDGLSHATTQTDPVEFTAFTKAPMEITPPRESGPPPHLGEKLQFQEPKKPSSGGEQPSTAATAASPSAAAKTKDTPASNNNNNSNGGGGGIKGLFRRLSRSKGKKSETPASSRQPGSAATSTPSAGKSDSSAGPDTPAAKTDASTERATPADQEESSDNRGLGSAFPLYHSEGVHDTLYPEGGSAAAGQGASDATPAGLPEAAAADLPKAEKEATKEEEPVHHTEAGTSSTADNKIGSAPAEAAAADLPKAEHQAEDQAEQDDVSGYAPPLYSSNYLGSASGTDTPKSFSTIKASDSAAATNETSATSETEPESATGSAMHLYHENGVHDSVYPAASS